MSGPEITRRHMVHVDSGTKFRRQKPLEAILAREDDLSFLLDSIKKYQAADKVDRTLIQIFSVYSQFAHQEGMCRTLLSISYGVPALEPIQHPDQGQLTPQAHRMVMKLNESLERLPTVYVDEDIPTILELLDADSSGEISAKDLLSEKVRARKEEIGLMAMQIDYLRKERYSHKAKKEKPQKGSTPIPQGTMVEIKKPSEHGAPSEGVTTPFSLSDWELFWTKRFFSQEEQHLLPIPTDSREVTAGAVERVGRGQISISPGSIVRALEFYLRKDVIQKALSTRTSYSPKEERDWIRIPRGKDRIMLVPDEENKKLVFFAARGDTLHRRA